MKRLLAMVIFLVIACSMFTGCGEGKKPDVIHIVLSDDIITVDGQTVSATPGDAVYIANDIIFYERGKGSDYGEGDRSDEHTREEADKHTVVHITQPGKYEITGSLSFGQIAVDIGDEADSDPGRVVSLILNNVDINCRVAPAIICYSAYECGSYDESTAKMDVDTSDAGFNIILARGSVNNIYGSHVARIYKPGTTKKLHKYDAAVESLVSMNIISDQGSGAVMNVVADNEGIESSLHLTFNTDDSAVINIFAGDDSINAGEDNISVITINGGTINANSGYGAEGDGIDSNGWIVINGGYVRAFANSRSMDSGLDSDKGTYINGGTVFSTGNMYDEIASDSRQSFVVFSFLGSQSGGNVYSFVKDGTAPGKVITDDGDVTRRVFYSREGEEAGALLISENRFTNMIYSSPDLADGDYNLYCQENGAEPYIMAWNGNDRPKGPGGMPGAAGMRPRNENRPGEKPGDMPYDKRIGDIPGEDFNPDGEKRGGRPFKGGDGMAPSDGQITGQPGDFGDKERNVALGESGFKTGGKNNDGDYFSQAGVMQMYQNNLFTIKQGANFYTGVMRYTQQ